MRGCYNCGWWVAKEWLFLCEYSDRPTNQTYYCDAWKPIAGEISTNADRIRAMTDEELAELISKWAFCGECVELFGYKVCETESCSDHWLSWLKSPV